MSNSITRQSLIKFKFLRNDVDDLILIHWARNANGSWRIDKGELLPQDVAIKEEWKDERYSFKRCQRLFNTVKSQLVAEHMPKPKKVNPVTPDPVVAPVVQEVTEEESKRGINPLENLTNDELRAILDARGIEYTTKDKKADLIDLIDQSSKK